MRTLASKKYVPRSYEGFKPWRAGARRVVREEVSPPPWAQQIRKKGRNKNKRKRKERKKGRKEDSKKGEVFYTLVPVGRRIIESVATVLYF